MLLNSLMRTKDKVFLEIISETKLKRLKLMAQNHKNFNGLKNFTEGDISKSKEAEKFYYLLK